MPENQNMQKNSDNEAMLQEIVCSFAKKQKTD